MWIDRIGLWSFLNTVKYFWEGATLPGLKCVVVFFFKFYFHFKKKHYCVEFLCLVLLLQSLLFPPLCSPFCISFPRKYTCPRRWASKSFWASVSSFSVLPEALRCMWDFILNLPLNCKSKHSAKHMAPKCIAYSHQKVVLHFFSLLYRLLILQLLAPELLASQKI